MQLYFIRHGQSQNNANWQNPEYVESPDPELTDLGRTQARCVADFLARYHPITPHDGDNPHNRYGFGLTHIYTSLMVRAVSTAAPTARVLGLPFTAWPDIHEEGGIFDHADKVNRPGLPGNPRSYFEQHYPELVLPSELDESGWWNRPFEVHENRQARADKVFAELLERHADREGQPEHRLVFFSHGGFFMRLMCAMLDLPWKHAAHQLKSWFYLSNGSISRIDIGNGELSVCYVNRTDHLPDYLSAT